MGPLAIFFWELKQFNGDNFFLNFYGQVAQGDILLSTD